MNIRHCKRMNDFLSEADLVSISIVFIKITIKHENYLRNTLELLILSCRILFTRTEDGDVANLFCFKMLLSISRIRHISLVVNFSLSR